ncbi:MAG: cupredoxin domain-containing protein [Actinomycetota bacterium]
MLRRLWPALVAIALLVAACGKPEITVRAEGADEGFVPVVVDVDGLAGNGVSLATDADGNPHLAYLAFPEQAPQGEEAPALDPLAPTLPAVMHAHLVDNIWTRGPVAEEQDIGEDDRTAIAVDADGIHHVAWTAGGQVMYSTNAEGEFSQAEAVGGEDATGVSMVADEQGSPVIAFVDRLTEAEGPATLVRVARPDGQGWEVETAAEASPDEPISTGVGSVGGMAMVAYGSEGATQFALEGGNRWTSELVDEGGGAAVSMAVTQDGVPHVAFFDGSGAVRHATPAANAWDATDVGEGATTSPTSIAVGEDGSIHVAWQTAEGIAYAAGPEGELAAVELPPATAGGTQPRVGTGPEGASYVAWFDAENGELQMAIRSDVEPLLAVPSPTAAPAGGPAAAECEPQGPALSLEAPPGAAGSGFDTDCLAVGASEAFTVDFTNADTAPHNFSIYTDDSATENLFEGEIVNPAASTTFEPDPIEEAGNMFFRCDLHPTTMTGTFVVAEAGGGGGGGGGS